MICIENAFFTSYRYQRYYKYKSGIEQVTIDPIIPQEYRLLAYLVPSLISFIINFIRLLTTGHNLGHLIKRYPQILLACCFTPFVFEGDKENSIKIWRGGSICNAFYIGCLPQILSLLMDYHRGVVNWDFIGLALKPEYITENNNALFKNRYGNSMFAITSGVFFLFLIILTFFTEKIFEKQGVYCKCFTILCFPCPSNCLDLDSKMSPSQPERTNPLCTGDNNIPERKQIESMDTSKDVKKPYVEMFFYSNRKKPSLNRNSSHEQGMELQVVGKNYLVSN